MTERQQTWACIRTGKGTAAIGTVEIEGPAAPAAIQMCFQPKHPTAEWAEGQIRLGRLVLQGQILDEGLAALETPNRAVLHCHGNPLILEQILKFLQTAGVRIVSSEQMLRRRFRTDSSNQIEAEARLESLRAASLLAVQCLSHQISGGLSAILRRWTRLEDLQTIRTEAEQILHHSRIARRLLRGVRIVLAGPPNSGKSTLLNRLLGREQAIVSDIPGTTRDWVTAYGRIGPLWVEWVDTAGLDEQLAQTDPLEQLAQQKAKEQMANCDLVLFVLDSSTPQWTRNLPTAGPIPTLLVLNKSDLSGVSAEEQENTAAVSALQGTGIETLSEQILHILQVDSFDPTAPAAFTERQIQILQRIRSAEDLPSIKTMIQQLFDAPEPV